MKDKRSYQIQLKKIQRLANGSRLSRLGADPVTYLKGMIWSKFLYRWFGKVWNTEKLTFFGSKLILGLPAGLDIYLLGAKTHDSEIRLAAFLLRFLKEGNIFFDIGAHVGYFSLLAEKCVGQTGKVVGFEASPTTFGYYKVNTSSYNNIKAEHLAVSQQEGEVVFFEYPMLYSEYNSIHGEQYDGKIWSSKVKPNKVTIPSVSLDNYCQTNHIYPHYIKIDVEGAEWMVLSGAKNLLDTNKPVIILEFIPPSEQERETSAHVRAVELLMDKGYKIYLIDADGGLKKTEYLHDLFDFFESDNIVCIHSENNDNLCI
ncbi:MAG: FkbM family methyltransferase [Saprospiraceae bacterium]|nr:FkbM family methyltransferase [Saprospiraceae bacterium]